MTSGHSGPELPGLQCLGDWSGEHLPVLDGGEPEGELVSEVVTGSSGSVTLNERRGSEVFETRSWAGERLTSSLRTSCSVHGKAVSDPEPVPLGRTLGHVHVLAVDGEDVGLDLAHHAP